MFRSSRREPAQLDPAEALLREVGAQLRQVRQERGEKLEDVAQYLRIRLLYLEALERGDLAAMPGRTYALGFLRSYADHLGFDGGELVGRVRSRVSDLPAGSRLRVRSPLPESRVPKAPIVVLSLAALAGIYAGWVYIDQADRAVVEVVGEVPDDLQALVRNGPSEAMSGSGAAALAAPEVILPEAPEPLSTPEVTPAESVPVAVSEPDRPSSEQSLAEQPDAVTPEAGPAPLRRSASDILAQLEPVAAVGASPAIYGVDEGDVRVILRARSEAWVQVSSARGAYRWARVLEPGEAFVVPDLPDLVLWTGNAAGVEIILDGAPLPPLGSGASVVRDVPLEPDALLRRLLPSAAGEATPVL